MDTTLKILSLDNPAQGFVDSELKIEDSSLELIQLPEGRFVAVRSKLATLLFAVSGSGANLLRKFDDLKDITNFKHNGKFVAKVPSYRGETFFHSTNRNDLFRS